MVFAMTARMMTITTNDTIRMATTIASVMATKPSWNAFSVSVSVSASEFLNCASIACEISAERAGSAICDHEDPDLVGAARDALLDGLVQVVPVEEHLRVSVFGSAPS